MSQNKLHLTIVSQEAKLFEADVDSVNATTSEGEITILPHHASTFVKLQTGELRFSTDNHQETFVVSQGFLDVNNDSTVTVMVDAATAARDISLEKAQAAIQQAEETLAQSTSQRELLMAEASLKLALLEIKVAQKTKKDRFSS